MVATQPRTWLSARVGGTQPAPEPGIQLDDLHGHTWTRHADDGLMHTDDDRHVQTWPWLHEHADLVEVTA